MKSISTNTLIAYAAKGGSTADDGSLSHSPFTAALWAPGQTALDSAEAWSGAPDQTVSLTVFASVHLTEATTFKISVASTLPGGLIRASTATRNLGPTASRIVAFPGRL